MELEETITRVNIEKMVKIFYSKVIRDKEIGYFFTDILGQDITNKDWKEHITLLTEFWLRMGIGRSKYNGNPFMPHTLLKGLNKTKFIRWLELFHTVVVRIFNKKISDMFKERSSIIATNFMKHLNIKE